MEAKLVVPPSGGSLEIGNFLQYAFDAGIRLAVPPSGGSLEIGNIFNFYKLIHYIVFPLRGDP